MPAQIAQFRIAGTTQSDPRWPRIAAAMCAAAKLATCDAAWGEQPGFAAAHSQPLTVVVAFRTGPRHSEGMRVTALDITAPLARYVRRFHQVAGAGHHVASPLGAWLLLALAGPACAGDDLRQLEEILGADADAAAGFAAELLAHPHPVVHAAAAVWGGNGSAADARIASWRAGLPPQVEHRPGARPAGTGRLGQAADLGA